ncbi:hypothetical protein GCM10023191_012830 [Actinoallomurus oryzae]|uniref:Mutator family transposase n=1 Tax=Actinoallomurus oryzae TaxID=502180 RepID=A0ABP8PFY0_9ACTN
MPALPGPRPVHHLPRTRPERELPPPPPPPRELRDLQVRVRQEQQTPDWQARYAVRSGVESTRPEQPGGNHRNGRSSKTVLTEVGVVPLQVPRDRAGEFEPQIVRKHARRIEGFDEAIVSLYAKGLTTDEIRAHLAEIYDVEVSRDLIFRVTDRVAEELAAWQFRPLDAVHPVVLIDAIHVKIREGQVAHRPIYVAVGSTVTLPVMVTLHA